MLQWRDVCDRHVIIWGSVFQQLYTFSIDSQNSKREKELGAVGKVRGMKIQLICWGDQSVPDVAEGYGRQCWTKMQTWLWIVP